MSQKRFRDRARVRARQPDDFTPKGMWRNWLLLVWSRAALVSSALFPGMGKLTQRVSFKRQQRFPPPMDALFARGRRWPCVPKVIRPNMK